MFGQTYKMYQTKNIHNQLRLNTATGEVRQIQDDGQSWSICEPIDSSGVDSNRFCLYATQNMWTFIMLDTYTGKNWQVQFSAKSSDYMFATPINPDSLAFPTPTNNWRGRFELIKTKNMWTFIMLDSYTGRLWQIQYSSHSLEQLMCIPINSRKLSLNENKSIFTVQPMTSMYQFYLINNLNGAMWKFQWTTKGDEYRWIEPFNQSWDSWDEWDE